jgi:hypothetical protein
VTDSPLSLSFFDPDRELYGTARSGATLLFEGRSPSVHPEGPSLSESGSELRAELDGRFSLTLHPLSAEVDLGGVSARVCRVSGDVGGTRVDCLGTVAETTTPPAWDELDALRTISALADDETAVLALARRPRDVPGHGDEAVTAFLIEAGETRAVEDARISTVYDGAGRQRSAGLELWLPGEEFPRRGSGAAIAGSSLQLEGVDVHAAIFRWRVEGRDAVGAYELMVRSEPAAAA